MPVGNLTAQLLTQMIGWFIISFVMGASRNLRDALGEIIVVYSLEGASVGSNMSVYFRGCAIDRNYCD